MIKSKNGAVRIEGASQFVAADFVYMVAGFAEMLIKETGSVSSALDKINVLFVRGLSEAIPDLNSELASAASRLEAEMEEANG